MQGKTFALTYTRFVFSLSRKRPIGESSALALLIYSKLRATAARSLSVGSSAIVVRLGTTKNSPINVQCSLCFIKP